jgi:Amt family ammonium transporter
MQNPESETVLLANLVREYSESLHAPFFLAGLGGEAMRRVCCGVVPALLLVAGLAASAAALVAPGLTNRQNNLAAQQEERITRLEKQMADARADLANAQTQLSGAKEQVAAAKGAGDNAWMLTSAALVLFMTSPGLALFYGGLVRKKNVLSTMMQSFAMMAIVTVVWVVVGYSLCFAPGNGIIGGLQHAFLHGVGTAPDADYAATIPQQTFMIYQLMFAIITPALISGAFAERMKFSAMAVFLVLWSLLVYDPLAHMIWGKGGLLNASLGGAIPVLDFAGGTVVHISSGVSALVCAWYLGKRLGYPKEPMPPHSMVLTFVGGCMLWTGWFGFNGGSALAASGLATSAFVATQLAAASGALSWSAMEWLRNGKPSALGAVSGAVAGLATVTQASGFVRPLPALLIGVAAGVCCYGMVSVVKAKLGYDDSLDAFGVHGIGGTIGALLTGIFATQAVNAIFKDAHGHSLPVGLIEGNWRQPLHQLTGVAVGWALAVVGTLVILKAVDATIGLRVSAEQEQQGLDTTQHGEEGYSWEVSPT